MKLVIDHTGAYATTRNTVGTVAQWFIPAAVVAHLDLDGMRGDGWNVTDYRTDDAPTIHPLGGVFPAFVEHQYVIYAQ
jgi:hypothetical protein